jgi:glycerol-3-phosphate cytidylyltransferase
MIIGYTTGVFDLFHIGHLNLLRNARSLCDRLIVGVSTDELVSYKHKAAVIPFHERVEIVRACRYVDAVIAQEDLDKQKAWERIKFDVLFVGDDWYETPSWRELEASFKADSVRVVYFPYTKGTSSSLINDVLVRLRNGT